MLVEWILGDTISITVSKANSLSAKLATKLFFIWQTEIYIFAIKEYFKEYVICMGNRGNEDLDLYAYCL